MKNTKKFMVVPFIEGYNHNSAIQTLKKRVDFKLFDHNNNDIKQNNNSIKPDDNDSKSDEILNYLKKYVKYKKKKEETGIKDERNNQKTIEDEHIKNRDIKKAKRNAGKKRKVDEQYIDKIEDKVNVESDNEETMNISMHPSQSKELQTINIPPSLWSK